MLCLPGAGGDREFWRPVAERLPDSWELRLLNWPGAGAQSHDPEIASAEDLVVRLGEWLDGPVDVVAQSLGGVIAIRLALAQPGLVRRLVLVATSGGVDVRALAGSDWRPDYLREFPHAARWVVEEQRDLSDQIGRVAAPTRLIWGDRDPISPLRVGELLAGLLPNAALSIVAGGTHSLAHDHPDVVASLIEAHLA